MHSSRVDIETLLTEERAPVIAHVRETECIGCTKCIQACPVDAIIGSAKRMHSILITECIGCGLCVEPCPVDCIDLIPQETSQYNPIKARERHHAIEHRAQIKLEAKRRKHAEKNNLQEPTQNLIQKQLTERQNKQAFILQALARVQNKKSKPS